MQSIRAILFFALSYTESILFQMSQNFCEGKDTIDWKKVLTAEEYDVMRNKGTEKPFSGKFNTHYKKGVYSCSGCGENLFSSSSKFDSGCGWPSFFEELKGDNALNNAPKEGDSIILKSVDYSHNRERISLECKKCLSHLGHLFDDGPEPTKLRYCINSVSLKFKPSGKEGK